MLGQAVPPGRHLPLLSRHDFPKKVRTVNRLAYGAIPFGKSPPPVPLYKGKPDRRSAWAAVEAATGKGPVAEPPRSSGQLGVEGQSLENANRGDRAPFELSLAGVDGWDVHLRQWLDGVKSLTGKVL